MSSLHREEREMNDASQTSDNLRSQKFDTDNESTAKQSSTTFDTFFNAAISMILVSSGYLQYGSEITLSVL